MNLELLSRQFSLFAITIVPLFEIKSTIHPYTVVSQWLKGNFCMFFFPLDVVFPFLLFTSS